MTISMLTEPKRCYSECLLYESQRPYLCQQVTLINDEVPVLMPGLKPVLDCAEGQEVIITAEYIYATDADSDDNSLTYMIARQPYHGVVRKNAIVVDRFIQADIVAGSITYEHTGIIVKSTSSMHHHKCIAGL